MRVNGVLKLTQFTQPYKIKLSVSLAFFPANLKQSLKLSNGAVNELCKAQQKGNNDFFSSTAILFKRQNGLFGQDRLVFVRIHYLTTW